MTIKIIRLNVQFNDQSPGLVLHRPDFRYDLSSEIVTSAIVNTARQNPKLQSFMLKQF